jgi:hypothetical protein
VKPDPISVDIENVSVTTEIVITTTVSNALKRQQREDLARMTFPPDFIENGNQSTTGSTTGTGNDTIGGGLLKLRVYVNPGW